MAASTGAGDRSSARVETIGSLWSRLVDLDRLDDVLMWPPDLFALTHRVLEASEAYRFLVSPPPGQALEDFAAGSAATSVKPSPCASVSISLRWIASTVRRYASNRRGSAAAPPGASM